MSKNEQFEKLKEQRKKRADEFDIFVHSQSFQTVMNKFIGFLMDEESSRITMHIGDATESESYTDGQRIVLGMMDYFFAPEYGPSDWVVAFKALLAHEVQHK